MAPTALRRAALSALVSHPIFDPTAIASDSRAGPAGMAPQRPGSAPSLPRHWRHATADRPSRAASADTRRRHRSPVGHQFLDLARIRRYTASSGEGFLLYSSEHAARPTTFAATFQQPNLHPQAWEPLRAHSCTASRRPAAGPSPPDLGHDRRRSHRGGQSTLAGISLAVQRTVNAIRPGSLLASKGGSILESA